MGTTDYLPLQAIGKINSAAIGGLCRWWYTPIENISVFPEINPETQCLVNEPLLLAGKSWYGPINIPEGKTGWEETQQENKAGIYYKEKVSGFAPGSDAKSHINIGNLAHRQLCVVGKMRSGGFYIILGNNVTGLTLANDAGSGIGSTDTAGTKLTLSGDFPYKAMILSDFDGNNAITPSPTDRTFTAYWFATNTNAAVNDAFIAAVTTKGVFTDGATVEADLRFNTQPMFLNIAIPVDQPRAIMWQVSQFNFGNIGPGDFFNTGYVTTTGGFRVYTTAYKSQQTQSTIKLIH